MNIRKSMTIAQHYRSVVQSEKNIFRTKLKAMSPSNWDINRVAKLNDLIAEGDTNIHQKFVSIFEEDKPLTAASLAPSSIKSKVVSEVLRTRALRAYKERNEAWQNVFDFLPDEQVPSLAIEFLIGRDDGWGNRVAAPSAAAATFAYPCVSDMPNPGDEYAYANYATYDSAVDTIKDRMGLSDVYVEAVGKIDADGREIVGTTGDLGFRVWWMPYQFNQPELFDLKPDFISTIPFRARIISKIRKIAGLEHTVLESRFSTVSEHCSGAFTVLVVASDTTTTQDYLGKVDQIRKVLNVPGVMVAPFGKMDEKYVVDTGTLGTSDANGIHHTAIIFYTGDQSSVIMDTVDLDANNEPIAAVSGFMPVLSAKHLLSEWIK